MARTIIMDYSRAEELLATLRTYEAIFAKQIAGTTLAPVTRIGIETVAAAIAESDRRDLRDLADEQSRLTAVKNYADMWRVVRDNAQERGLDGVLAMLKSASQASHLGDARQSAARTVYNRLVDIYHVREQVA